MRLLLPCILAAQSLLLARCLGYHYYQKLLPNGDVVVNPCNDKAFWSGVGHLSVLGGGARNVFGVDFAKERQTWSKVLCEKDSDGDGRTNGEELGDPHCVWTKGQKSPSTTRITHPGVCEPIDSQFCQNKSVPNSPQEYHNQLKWLEQACFQCNAIKAEGVETLEFRMPLTKVPAVETKYMCMTYEFSNSSVDFHVIAIEPIINNSDIMHHMLLFACNESATVIDIEPRECSGMRVCPGSELVGAWSSGLAGQCFHQDAGIRVGATGYKKFVIQYHWNNPKEEKDLQDSSGLKLHYTSKLRAYNLAVMMVGQTHIQIPPRSPHTLVTGECPSTCTRSLFTGDIRVVAAANHMHYLGVAMNLELYRCGKFVTNITNDPIYRYDTPKFHEYVDPLVLKAGDMIRTNCHYAALNTTIPTVFGEATSDEMCFGFLTFYPRENMPNGFLCVQNRNTADCDPVSFKGCSRDVLQTYKDPGAFNQTDVYTKVTSVCKTFGPCTEECKTEVRRIRTAETCVNNEVNWLLLKRHALGRQFLAAFTVCDLELYEEDHPGCTSTTDLVKAPTSAGAAVRHSFLVTLASLLLRMIRF